MYGQPMGSSYTTAYGTNSASMPPPLGTGSLAERLYIDADGAPGGNGKQARNFCSGAGQSLIHVGLAMDNDISRSASSKHSASRNNLQNYHWSRSR